MFKKEIYNIKDKNSQEILLHLQRKNILKNNIFLEDFQQKTENKVQNIENDTNNENLPPTRMKQYLNKSYISKSKNPKLYCSIISKETNEITMKNTTPKFVKIEPDIKNETNNENINMNNSQYSFSKKTGNNSINYLNYNLHENLEKSKYNKDEIYHLYLPKKYKDDEQYKSNLYKYLKEKHYKNNIMRDRGNKTKILKIKDNFTKINKKKKVNYVKKKCLNKIIFFDGADECIFNLFKDDDIGIDKKWQMPLINQKYDNDIDSDEEQIENGKAKMLYDLRLAIIKWSQNKKVCYNYRYLDCPLIAEHIKRYSSSV